MLKSRALGFLLFAAVLFSTVCYAAVSERIAGNLSAGPKVALTGNVHGMARPENDLGRADGSRLIQGITLSLMPSAAQKQDLNQFLAQLGDPHSPNFHKYLTPQQFGERFGMSESDLAKITAWLQTQGFSNISIANGRNQVSFDGTVAQIESAFAMEMHHYLVNGEVHMANAGEPSVPAALSGIVGSLWHITDFSPKPRVAVKPNLTSYVSGNHFLTPGDFAKIYDIGPSLTGSGQKIAIIGQTTVSTTDLNNFRSAAGLPASTVTMTVAGGTGTRCSGDEGESDLDIEWAGGVAPSASVTFVFAGLGTGETCTNRQNNVWNALQYAIQNNVAPFISTSYGFCESGLGQSFVVSTLQPLLRQGQTQGQTLVSASGDSGAADCEPSGSTSATTGLAVDAPASIPETTGAGGNEFTGDAAGAVTGTPPNTTAGANSPYWSGSNAGSDAVVTALQYIPEQTWNDTPQSISSNPPGGLAASGGGASIFFSKPSWQTGTGVPADSKRDIPDISLSASNFHDPYLICSEDGTTGSCSSGFRDSSGNFTAVGGTSAAAPTFTAILALINQFLSNPGNTGLAPVNPMLYSLWASTPSAFHDITTGTNMVPCTAGTTNCPTGTTQIGFSAAPGPGYDQVTGIGSPDVTNLANAWAAALAQYTLSAGALSPASTPAGTSTTSTITVTPNTGTTFTGTVNFACSGLPSGATCAFNPTTVTVTPTGPVTTTLTIQTPGNIAAGTSSVTVTGSSTGGARANTTLSLVVSATTMSFSLQTNLSGGTATVAQGQTTGPISIALSSSSQPPFVSTSGSSSSTALPVTYTCSGSPAPAQATCLFNGSSGSLTTSATSVTLTIATTAPTGKMEVPFGDGGKIFYAALLPGLLGVVFTIGLGKRPVTGGRMLALVVVLGISTLWIASCGGTNTPAVKNLGTPTGNYQMTVNATTGGSAPITSSVTFTLTVTP